MPNKRNLPLGIRRIRPPMKGNRNSGHPHGGARPVWYERSCGYCSAVTRGSLGKIRVCGGMSPDRANNRNPKAGCGRSFL